MATKKARQTRLRLDQEKELTVAEWYREHPEFYDKSMTEYRNKQKRQRLLEEKAAELDITVDSLKGYLRDRRTEFTKAVSDQKKSGSGAKTMTPRKKFVLEVWAFFKDHIADRRVSYSTRREARQEEEQPTQDDDTDNPEEEDEDDDHDDDEDFAGRSAQTTPTLEPTQQSMSATEDEGDSTMSEPQVINATPTESAPPSTTPVTTNKRAEIKKRKKKVTRNRDSGDSEATLLKEMSTYFKEKRSIASAAASSGSRCDVISSFCQHLETTMRELPRERVTELQSKIMTMVYQALNEQPSAHEQPFQQYGQQHQSLPRHVQQDPFQQYGQHQPFIPPQCGQQQQFIPHLYGQRLDGGCSQPQVSSQRYRLELHSPHPQFTQQQYGQVHGLGPTSTSNTPNQEQLQFSQLLPRTSSSPAPAVTSITAVVQAPAPITTTTSELITKAMMIEAEISPEGSHVTEDLDDNGIDKQ